MVGEDFDSVNWVVSTFVFAVGELTIIYYGLKVGARTLVWSKVTFRDVGINMVNWIKMFVKI